MLNISEAATIAIHSMIYMANRKKSTHSLKEIAAVFNISANHLSKVLQRLVKQGLLVSVKGPKGGFKIKQGKEKATLMEIYKAIEGRYTRRECLFNCSRPHCSCVMKPMIYGVNKAFEDFMTANRLCDLKL